VSITGPISGFGTCGGSGGHRGKDSKNSPDERGDGVVFG
jgi:hypothetical protein